MFEKINKKSLTALMLAGAITVTGATTAFAANGTGAGNFARNGQPAKVDFAQAGTQVKTALDKLVTAGTITQAQEEAVLKLYTPGEGMKGPQGERKNPMDELVTAGTITQAQLDAIESAMKSGMESKQTMEDILAGLVTAGTLTQAQVDAIQQAMPARDGKGGPQGERKNPMDELVTAGTITQAQLDAIESAMKTARESKQSMEDVLAGLVTAGTLTQEQVDAIQKAMPVRDDKGGPQGEGKSPMDELVTAGTITQEQMDAIGDALKAGRESKQSMEDILAGLVTAGTLTQEQVDAIQKAMPVRDDKGGPQGERKNPMDELVTAGTITQVQLDAVESAMKTARESKQSMEDVLAGLVTAGTLTQAQSDAIQKTMPGKDGNERPQGFAQGERKNPLDELVTAGTITQAQADAIESAVKAVFEAGKSK